MAANDANDKLVPSSTGPVYIQVLNLALIVPSSSGAPFTNLNYSMHT